MDCCENEELITSSTFAQIFGNCQSWLKKILDGEIFSSESENEEDQQNVIVSILFIFHITFVLFFLAHHCRPRGTVQNRQTFD